MLLHTMITQILQNLRYLFLFISFGLLLFTGCEEEEFEVINSNQEQRPLEDDDNSSMPDISRLEKRRLSYQEVVKNEKLKSLFKLNHSFKSRSDATPYYYDEPSGITIDLSEVNYVSNGDYHSYTFGVTRDQPSNRIENITISLQKDWSYKAYLLSYNISPKEVEAMAYGIGLDKLAKNVTVRELDIKTELIISNFQTKNDPDDPDHRHGSPWCKKKTISNATGMVQWIDTKCNQDNGGGGDSGGDNTDGGSGIGGNNNNNNNNNNNDDQTGGGGNGGTSAAPCFDCHGDFTDFITTGNYNKLIDILGFPRYNSKEADLLKNIYNYPIASGILDFLHNYKKSSLAISTSKSITVLAAKYDSRTRQNEDFSESIINFINNRKVSNEVLDYAKILIEFAEGNYKQELTAPTTNIKSYEQRVKRITKHLKSFGDPEEKLIAEYVDSLIPEFTKMKSGEVFDIYKMVVEVDKNLLNKYIGAIFDPVVEAAIPFIIYAATEATLGAALPLLSRIPASFVARGAKLEKMVKEVGLMGTMGKNNTIRIVSTNNPVNKARELFNTLTKNALSKVNEADGVVKANMGNGNFILFRPSSASTSNFPATITLDFRAAKIWTKQRHVKFK